MKISIFAPYGPYSQESGVVYLLGNYLKGMFSDVSQLKCNGVFSICERDAESSWKRDIDTCTLCMADQAHLQKWSDLDSVDASRCIGAQEIEMTKRWLQEQGDAELVGLEHNCLPLFEYCEQTFQKRFAAEFDLQNKRHVQVMRKMMLSALRMQVITNNFYNTFTPDMCFVAGGGDLLSKTFIEGLSGTHTETVRFRWDMHERTISIHRARSDEAITCELLLDGVSNMRADHRTWPDELRMIIDDILDYLDLKYAQLQLPIGHKKAV